MHEVGEPMHLAEKANPMYDSVCPNKCQEHRRVFWNEKRVLLGMYLDCFHGQGYMITI